MNLSRAVIAIVTIAIAANCGSASFVGAQPSPNATAHASSSATAAASQRSSAAPSASALPTPTSSTPAPTADDQRIVAAVVAFARARDARTFSAVPLADQVGLGLDDWIPLPRSSAALARAEDWVLDVDEFKGRLGTFSALDLLARNVDMTVSIGPHAHCSNPLVVTTPAALADLRRISVQPKQVSSCQQWWVVDLYVSADGRITVVSLDLSSP